MKSLLPTAAILTFAAGTAFAVKAVNVESAPAPLPVASTYNWTGAYIGVNASGGYGTFKHPFTSTTGNGDFAHVSTGGFLGGVQAGYNWQFGQMVHGMETDVQGSTVKGTFSFGGATILETKVDWFGTLRARIGYTPVDRFLVYGTGGLAYGEVRTSIPVAPLTSSRTKAGWTIGAGAEYAMNTNWTIKTEFLYTDLGKSTISSTPSSTLKNEVAFQTGRVGVNYKF